MRQALSSARLNRPPSWWSIRRALPYVDLRVDLDRALLTQLHYQWELDEPLLERHIERVFDPNSVPYPEV